MARYTEDSDTYVRINERLMKKYNTAKSLVPGPEILMNGKSQYGLIYYGTSSYSALEAQELMAEKGFSFNAMRIKSFPFNSEVEAFIDNHEYIFVIEQNRDAQMRSLLMIELDANPRKLIKVLNYDGTPLTATLIVEQISAFLNVEKQQKLN